MRCLPLALFVLLLVAGGASLRPAQGEDEMDGGRESPFLQLGPATVLASPGTPQAIDTFLPGGTRPSKLAWPLPKGPVVVLGLPHQDAVAQQIADAFQIDTDDLGGGYRIAAWRAKTRPIVLVMAADPAALHAARFEFDVDAPMEMMAPGMRSLDFKRPNQEAGFAVRRGTRLVQPRHRLRGYDVRQPGSPVDAALVTTAAGARANRLWLSLEDLGAPGIAKTLALARQHGVTPVAVASGLETKRCADPTYLAALSTRLRALRDRLGIEHFAVAFRRPPDAPLLKPGQEEAHAARALAKALRPGGLRELTLVPSAHSDRLAKTCGSPPDLRGIPEAVIGWSGPTTYASRITRADAERRVKEAGVPVVLLDHWAAPFQDPSLPYVPSLPRGRSKDLHDVLDGVIVIGRHGTEGMLEALWAPIEEPRFGASRLEPLCPILESGNTPWLVGFAHRLRKADKETLGLVPWMAPLGREAEAVGPLITGGAFVEFPTTLGGVMRLDGRLQLDEPLWRPGRGGPFLTTTENVELLMGVTPEGLHIGVRAPKAALKARELFLQFSWRRPGTTQELRAELTIEGWRFAGALAGGAPATASARGAVWLNGGGLMAELLLDRFALGGDLHAGRALECSIRWGPQRLWPKDEPRGALFIGAGRVRVAAPKAAK